MKQIKSIWVYLTLAVLLLILFFLSLIATNTVKSAKLSIITSFYPMYFFASEIGGDKVNITNITPAGVEPHDYEPTMQQVVKINQSDMLVLNGGIMEAWGNKIKDQLSGSNVLVITAGEGLINTDPHIYLDPILAKEQAEKIEQGFEEIDSKNAAYYQDNAEKLNKKLDELNTDFEQGFSTCREKNFVTSHAAFGYLAKRYGLNQIAIGGISPDEEPSLRKLAEITDFVRRENIKVIFFERMVSPKFSEIIANEIGAKILILDPIEGISDDDVKMGKNYFTIMEDNLRALREALKCGK